MKQLVALLLTLLLLCAAVSVHAEGRETEFVLNGFDTVDIYGAKADASLYEGYDLIMLNVWATYCPPCLEEMPELGRLAEEWAPKGVRILGLVSDVLTNSLEPDEGQMALARQVAEKTGASYTHLVPDLELVMKVLMGVQYVPTTIFLTGDGRLTGQVYVGSYGYDDWNTAIETTLKGLEAK